MITLILPILTAFILAQALAPRCLTKHPLVAAGCALGIGPGLASVWFFLWLYCTGVNGTAFIVADTIFWIAAFLSAWRWRGRRIQAATPVTLQTTTAKDVTVPQWLTVIAGIVLLAAGAVFILQSVESPHGEWDAWSIWNLRARCIYRLGSNWEGAFHHQQAHSGYPLLLPLTMARAWSILGHEDQSVPVGVAAGFTIAIVMILAGTLNILRDRLTALLGVIALGAVFHFAKSGASQYADMPLSLFFISTMALLLLSDTDEEPDGLLLLAGITAGLSAWTKNEGILFIPVLLISHSASSFLSRKKLPALRSFFMAGAGMFPGILCLILFKTTYGETNDIMAAQGFEPTLAKLKDLSRHSLVMYGMASGILSIGHGIVPALAVVSFLVGFRKCDRHEVTGILRASIQVLIMLSGYYLVYVITHQELQWQLDTTILRILIHLLPTAILSLFLILKTHEINS